MRVGNRAIPILQLWCFFFGALLTLIVGTAFFSSDNFLNFFLAQIIMIGAAGTCFVVGASFRNERRYGWISIGIGSTLWTFAAICSCFSHFGEVEEIRDVAYILRLSSYLAFIPGAFFLSGLPSFSAGPILWVESGVALLSVAALTETFLLPIALQMREAYDMMGQFMYAGSAIGDTLLLSITCAIVVLHDRFPTPSQLLLIGGFFLCVLGDAFYFPAVTSQLYFLGNIADIFWLLGLTSVALSGLVSRFSPWRDGYSSVASWKVIIRPLIFRGGALAVIGAKMFIDVSMFSLLLVISALLLDVVRVSMRFNELKTLAETEKQARTDDLTGLPNRRMFYLKLDEVLSRSTRHSELRHAVLLIDLDRFKEINDTLGHSMGDSILIRIGERLRLELRAQDALARLGGDEFAVLLVNVSLDAARKIAERIVTSLQQSMYVEDMKLSIDGSVGIVMYPQHGVRAEELIQRADIAMYTAKQALSNVAVYQAEDDVHSRNRLKLLGGLRPAIDEGQMVMYFQPKFDLKKNEVTGVESLIRWRNPDYGLLLPGMFVPLAERSGLMRQLTHIALEQSIHQCRRWVDKGLSLSVACNLYASSLIDGDFSRELTNMLDQAGLNPSHLYLEITESALLGDIESSKKVIDELRGVGIKVSLDDFGTGYSSLSYLCQLNFDELKLDQSFIRGAEKSARSAEIIVNSTIKMAHSLGVQTVGEGVETIEMLRRLRHDGCDMVQGYYISPALSANDFEAWLYEWNADDDLRSSRLT